MNFDNAVVTSSKRNNNSNESSYRTSLYNRAIINIFVKRIRLFSLLYFSLAISLVQRTLQPLRIIPLRLLSTIPLIINAYRKSNEEAESVCVTLARSFRTPYSLQANGHLKHLYYSPPPALLPRRPKELSHLVCVIE